MDVRKGTNKVMKSADIDYEHIFKGDLADLIPENIKIMMALKNANSMKQKGRTLKVHSDQPTALIAPSDYQHIFKGEFDDEKKKVKNLTDKIKKIPSDTPTALIAPSDFEHIYWDPHLSSKKKNPTPKAIKTEANKAINVKEMLLMIQKDGGVKKYTGSPSDFKINKMNSHQKSHCKMEVSISNRPLPTVGEQQEVLPESIMRLVKQFIEKQSKNYTHH